MFEKIKQVFSSNTEGTKKPTKKEMLIQTIKDNDYVSKMSIPVQDYFNDFSSDQYEDIINAMRKDYQIKSDTNLLVSKIFDNNWSIIPADEENKQAIEAAEFMEKIFSRNSDTLVKQLKKYQEALYWGKSVNEAIWSDPAKHNGLWIMEKLINLDSSRFNFDNDGYLTDERTDTKLLQKYKWVVFTNNEEMGNLNGSPQIIPAYWPWHFRNMCIESSVIYIDKAVLPSVVALLEASGSQPNITTAMNAVATQLMNLKSSSGAAMANIKDIKVIEATGKADEYVNLIDMFDKMISKAILSTPRLTNETKYSSNDSADRDNDLVNVIAEDLAVNEVIPCANTIIKWHMELNFPNLSEDLYPSFMFIRKDKASIDNVISMMNLGVPMKKDSLIEDYGIPIATEDDEAEDNVIVKEVTQQQPQSFSKDLFFSQEKTSRKEQSDKFKSLTQQLRNIKKK